jgi:hypothetical protein
MGHHHHGNPLPGRIPGALQFGFREVEAKEAQEAAAKKKPPKPPRPTVKPQFIGFFGSLVNGKGAEEEQFVQVLAGLGAPTVTGGWADWVEIERPQRVSLTVLRGYPPVRLTIPVLFEALLDTEGRMNVEREIQKLEWMAGRGRPLGTHPQPGGVWAGTPGHDALGDSPLIEIFTTDSHGKEVPLIPVQFQSLQYVMTDIAYDTGAVGSSLNPSLASPLRDAGGARLRQSATVTLLQHVGAPGTSFDSPSVRAAARQAVAKKGEYRSSTATLNTVAAMAAQFGRGQVTRVIREILEAPQNRANRHIPRDAYKPFARTGTRVFIPYTASHQ